MRSGWDLDEIWMKVVHYETPAEGCAEARQVSAGLLSCIYWSYAPELQRSDSTRLCADPIPQDHCDLAGEHRHVKRERANAPAVRDVISLMLHKYAPLELPLSHNYLLVLEQKVGSAHGDLIKHAHPPNKRAVRGGVDDEL